MANLLHYRKKNRSLVECFLQTQNNISLLLTLPSPSVRMEWMILAISTLLLAVMVSEGPRTIQMGAICVGVIPVFSKAAFLWWYEGSSVKAMLCYHWSGMQGSLEAGALWSNPRGRMVLPVRSSLSSGAFCQLLAWLAAPARRVQVSLMHNLPAAERDPMAWSVSSIRPCCT